jgi:hypothetical protein
MSTIPDIYSAFYERSLSHDIFKGSEAKTRMLLGWKALKHLRLSTQLRAN